MKTRCFVARLVLGLWLRKGMTAWLGANGELASSSGCQLLDQCKLYHVIGSWNLFVTVGRASVSLQRLLLIQLTSHFSSSSSPLSLEPNSRLLFAQKHLAAFQENKPATNCAVTRTGLYRLWPKELGLQHSLNCIICSDSLRQRQN